MSATRWAFALLSAAVLLAVPAPSEARFGKRSSSSDDSDDNHSRSKSPHSSAPAKPHSAEPAHPYSGGGGGYSPSYRNPRCDRPYYPYRHHYHPYGYGWGWGYYPFLFAPPPPAAVVVESPPVAEVRAPASALVVSAVGVGIQAHGSGAVVDVSGVLEGQRWGVNALYSGIAARAEEPGYEEQYDQLHLFDAHLTYALLSGRRGRVRLELGVNVASAPDIAFVGPDAGVSAVLGLAGPLGVEGAAHLTPYPHRKLDGSVGAVLALGRLAIRGGWRALYLDDQGLVDGVRHTDLFRGPYVGAGFAF